MPVTTMSIADDWTAARNSNPAVPAPIAGIEYLNSVDKQGPLIILNFNYTGQQATNQPKEPMHVTMPLGPGGNTASFHLTAGKSNSIYATGKSAGPAFYKNNPSKYFDFLVQPNGVLITAATKITIADGSDKPKPVAVTSAQFAQPLVNAVVQFMQAFVLYMVERKNGQLG